MFPNTWKHWVLLPGWDRGRSSEDVLARGVLGFPGQQEALQIAPLKHTQGFRKETSQFDTMEIP